MITMWESVCWRGLKGVKRCDAPALNELFELKAFFKSFTPFVTALGNISFVKIIRAYVVGECGWIVFAKSNPVIPFRVLILSNNIVCTLEYGWIHVTTIFLVHIPYFEISIIRWLYTCVFYKEQENNMHILFFYSIWEIFILSLYNITFMNTHICTLW